MIVLEFAVLMGAVVLVRQRLLAVPDGVIALQTIALFTLACIILLTMLVVSFGVLFQSLYNERIRRVSALVEEQIARGDLRVDLHEESSDALGSLIASINRLSRSYFESLEIEQERAANLATLNLVASTITRTLDLQEVLNISLKEVSATMNLPQGAIYMSDDRSESLTMVSYDGLSEETLREAITVAMGEGIIGKTASTKERQTTRTAGADPAIGIIAPFQVATPLVTAAGRLLGVLLIGGSEKRTLTIDEQNLLVTLCYQIALAIDNAQLYEKVSQYAQELERKVEARTRQLNRAVEELSVALERAQEADRVKSMLLSTVSHELRTPLATIKGNASLIRAHHERLSVEVLKEHLTDIEEETDKLTELISNLLDMSRIEGGVLQIDPNPFNLVEVVNDTVSAARIRTGRQAIDIVHVDDDVPLCLGDARRIEQVMNNLLDNAVKYSEDGTPVTVCVRRREAMTEVAVADRGKGIEPEKQVLIFDRFFQVMQSGDSGRHGFGLGLSICRGLIDAHTGKIWLESTPGEGSPFYYTIPSIRETDP
ncbi:MAG: ATP-binding protein [Anaerolineae bacterium]